MRSTTISAAKTTIDADNFDDFEIRWFMRIAQKRLNEIKAVIRRNLIAAGITP